MADTIAINVQQGAKATPAVYTVPGAVSVEPLSAFAHFDGTGAASAFFPALTFYSDAGLILARVFPGSSVAAGGTADVTFAPFLDQAAAGTTPTSSTSLPSAFASAGGRSQTCFGNLPIDFDFFWKNDASFGYENVTAGRARYITITTEGWYLGKFNIFWNSDFTVGDFPFIEPSVFVGGFADTLVNTAPFSWNDTGGTIGGEQFTAAEMAHHELTATVLFEFTAADWGDATPGVGVNVRAGGGRTKFFGGNVALSYLGTSLASVPIV